MKWKCMVCGREREMTPEEHIFFVKKEMPPECDKSTPLEHPECCGEKMVIVS